MRKTGLALALLMILCMGCVSTPPVVDPTIIKIVETGQTKDAAFDLSMRWLSESFRSSKAVIEYTDKALGTINGKGVLSVLGGFDVPVDISFSIVIDLKDGRARLSFRPTSYNIPSMSGPASEGINPFLFEKFTIRADEMAASYKAFMSAPAADW